MVSRLPCRLVISIRVSFKTNFKLALMKAGAFFLSVLTLNAFWAMPHAWSQSEDNQKMNLQAFKLGFAVGPSINFNETSSASLAPFTNTLQSQKLGKVALKLSTSLVYNRIRLYKKSQESEIDRGLKDNGSKNKAYWSQLLDAGQKYSYPDKFSYVAALNIAELSSGGSGLNKTVEGGIGVGIRIDPNFHCVALFEFGSARQIRDNFKKGEAIQIATGQVLIALDETDNKYFYTKPVLGLSLRFVYVFGNGATLPTNSIPVGSAQDVNETETIKGKIKEIEGN